MHDKFLKPYNAQDAESRIYTLWQESGFFNPDKLPDRHEDPYTIIMPPPNVTGVLHMGHALMLTVQDTLIRYKRMRGFKTLWLPGTDHAAIATQSKVEKEIKKNENKSRHDLGREELLHRVNIFAQQSHDAIVSQIRAMGASCDWSREAFTLDEKRNIAVRTVFKKMYTDGLIYRGNRIVNWDPKGQTTISDDEIVYEERDAKLYTFKYSKDFPISISTTRLETKVGDVAVAVHPEDERYAPYVGQTFHIKNFCGVPLDIKIITDKEVDKEFGTGALGVTPAHSMIDSEMAEKHNLQKDKIVINEYAKMTDLAGTILAGKKTTEARDSVAQWLRSEGLLEKEETIKQNVSTAERTGGIVEPLPKLQWFVAVDKPFTLPFSDISGITNDKPTTLKEIMRQTVYAGQIEIIPDYFNKTYFHWIDNLKDWCISRQIWYGHRIPVWYKNEAVHCDVEAPKDGGWIQDEDTLDTWFSSALWTFSTLGWPSEMTDLKLYHPTDLLETGHDILFFWVARMILVTGYTLGTIPFKKVYLNGLVRDAQGRKISKSLGNNIDPVDLISKFGTDALRMALLVGNTPGIDTRWSDDKAKGYKNFANKLWNITRFILESTQDTTCEIDFASYSDTDKKLTDERRVLIADITDDMEAFRFYMAAEKIYHYIWHTLADIHLEGSKKIFLEGTEEDKISRKQFLLATLHDMLRVLHPFMPFVTEEIWQTLPDTGTLLMIENWPII